MPPADTVSPGIWGFISFAALAVVLYFLMRNMNARMRRMSYRQQDAGAGPFDGQVGQDSGARSARDADGASRADADRSDSDAGRSDDDGSD